VSLVDWTKLDENEQLETAKLIIEDIDRDSTFISSKSSREFPVFARKGEFSWDFWFQHRMEDHNLNLKCISFS